MQVPLGNIENAGVVGDEQNGAVLLVSELLNQIHHIATGVAIEGSNRFVSENDFGL